MNVNALIKKTLAPTKLPVYADFAREKNEEYIVFNYVSEPYDNFSDNAPENDYTSLQLHYFTKKNPHSAKKEIAELLFDAGFDVAIGATSYEEDTKYNHTVYDIGIDGVVDLNEREG